ncbi:NADH-quinone oxidoreductase subunit N [Allosalinactinospora lopnorensis]|uniref:NADH-quinone oxidoreductase subunit N n=1 Tax=Allosalinactinospora lopnorensis TaxID=1352348 RepID=UPI000623CD3B|nr:proton-conducting transporter membrane subunit [Allosalinactinospora lopnorensis]
MAEMKLVALAPEAALALTAVAGLLVGSWMPRRRQWIVRTGVAVAVAGGLIITIGAMVWPGDTLLTGGYVVDLGTHAARAVVLAALLLTVPLAADSVAGHPRESEFYVLLVLAALGTITLAGANDLLVLAVAYLLASIPLYALAGFAKDPPGTEATLKYYLLGALLGVLLLTGATLLLGAGGATDYTVLAQTLPAAPRTVVAVGVTAVLAGLLFKAGGVPAHFWVPDVTEGASAPVAAFVTTVPKIGALVALYRLGDQVVVAAPLDWTLVAALLAAASMTLGNLAAFFQRNVRRLLAYSTISQVGYLLMAVAAAGGGSALALPSLLFYLAGYAVSNLAAFAVVCALPRTRMLDDYTGLFRHHPWLSLSLVVSLLSLVGTPPTAVFVGKLTVFTTAVDAGLAWLVVLAIINTVASLFYYLRWILPLFQTRAGTPANESGPETPQRRSTTVALAAGVLVLLLGLAAGPTLSLLQ